MEPSKLINDLSRVPNIIGSLGLAIAEAQKQFNLDYINSVDALVTIAARLMGKGANTAGIDNTVRDFVFSLAPPRYQFTETELAVKLDLSQSIDIAGQAGLGFGFSGVVVNASFALGYSSDYQAAAECRTKIHAVLPGDNKAMFDALLVRAKEIDAAEFKVPDRSPLDANILAASSEVMKKLGVAPAPAKDVKKADGQPQQ
jgi:hypothetical protein